MLENYVKENRAKENIAKHNPKWPYIPDRS